MPNMTAGARYQNNSQKFVCHLSAESGLVRRRRRGALVPNKIARI